VNAGSLFSGVGGLDLGLHRAGIRHAFFCESDPWRRTVLAAHWPGVPVYEDVRDVECAPEPDGELGRPDQLRDSGDAGTVAGVQTGGVDLLCGGFPCQDLSVAGQRRGLNGDRSGLFFEFARIIDAVRPRWVLLENVPGLLSSNGGRDFGTVLGTLADIGYGVAWRVVDSRFFGVPQRRRRVFIVGTVADGDPRGAAERAGEILAVGTRCPGHPPTGESEGPRVAAPLTRGSASGRGVNEPGRRQEDDVDIVPALGWNWQTGGDFRPMFGEQAPALQKNQTTAVGVRRLTPVECERLQAWPDGWTNPDGTAPDSRRYAACGDGVTASVAEWIGRRLVAAS
jgi:DNA (cytosine-5)-methyltransferase 1